MSDLVEAAASFGSAGAAAALALRAPELLKEIYGDLAKPGVAQVGKAIGELLGLGNTILLPLRLLNKRAAEFERENFELLAQKFSQIPEEKVVEVNPEIGLPILDGLSQTRDGNLRDMFAELLVNSAREDKSGSVHPSYVGIVSSLAPDEARLLKFMKQKKIHPYLSITRIVDAKKHAKRSIEEFFMEIPGDLDRKDCLSIYLASLARNGLINIYDDRFSTGEHAYDHLINEVKNRYAGIREFKILEKVEDNTLIFEKAAIFVTDYGFEFAFACLGMDSDVQKNEISV
ncbi:DUF4393 domain-containing protein [Novosphingobium aquimarinum]|uniref:DUF4393 domain-containing protein n=1 Tax=Novosphingobium aquimarinum TaxID=2682494 RepID=UPI0012EC2621|nr:DUF4393 domain-containing protein [Novosphingobium aquimarinum]